MRINTLVSLHPVGLCEAPLIERGVFSVFSVSFKFARIYNREAFSQCVVIHFECQSEVDTVGVANARRLFVTDEEESMNPMMSPSSPGNLSGVISILDGTPVRRLPLPSKTQYSL